MTVLLRPFSSSVQTCDNKYKIANSMATETNATGISSSSDRYLYRDPNPSGGNLQKWTLSVWIKAPEFSSTRICDIIEHFTSGTSEYVGFGLGDKISYAGANFSIVWDAYVNDNTAWTHLVLAFDSTQGNPSDRCKLYLNGAQVNILSGSVSLNSPSDMTSTMASGIGYGGGGYVSTALRLAEFRLIDGQQLDATNFGMFSDKGEWVPIEYLGSYGTVGFYLDFSDPNDLGKDVSGNGLHYTSSVSAPTPSVDSPTNNCPTQDTYNCNAIKTNGARSTSTGGGANIVSTHTVSKGKYYVEYHVNTVSPGNNAFIGITTAANNYNGVTWTVGGMGGYSYRSNGQKYENGSTGSAYGDSYTTSDTIGIAVDLDNNKLWFSKNGVWQGGGDPEAGTGEASIIDPGEYYFAVSMAVAGVGWTHHYDELIYTPPEGFLPFSLNNKLLNEGEPSITAPDEYFDVVTYAGNGTTQDITSLKFKPDLVVIKRYDATSNWKWTDSVRGATKALSSNTTGAETTDAGGLTSFNNDGFTVGDNTDYNAAGGSYAAYCWKKSVNSGFDIVEYTGTGSPQQVAHNLGVVPGMIWVKCLDASSTVWVVYHQKLTDPANQFLLLNSNAVAQNLGAAVWNSTLPTSSDFSVGTNASLNANGSKYVAYIFADVPGFSKYGSFLGTATEAGTGGHNISIPLNFKPKFWISRNMYYVWNWDVYDAVRNPHNPQGYNLLFLQLNNATSNGYTDQYFFSNKIIGSAMFRPRDYTFLSAAIADYPEINKCSVPATGGT